MSKKSSKSKPSEDRVIENRKARYQYTISDTLEAGMQLMGSEVKAVRAGLISIAEGFVRAQMEPPALYVHQLNIGDYAPAGGGALAHKATRVRKLLAHKREIVKLARQVETKGMTIVPLKLYFKNGYAKLLIGLAEGKGHSDKRETIKKRETDREMARAMSRRDR
jgi:SsrA-binding protein